MKNIQLESKEYTDITKHAREVETTYDTLRRNFEKYRQMYFMEWTQKPKNAEVDANDWKITPSPSARNEVTGVKRLLDTSELHVKVQEGDATSQSSDIIERGLKRIAETSGNGRRARLISDATLAASLYGPVILTADFYDDILASGNLPKYKKMHIEKQAMKAPAIISVINSEEASYELDDGLMILFQRKYKLRGAQVKSRYGELDNKPMKDNTEYVIRDIYTPEYRIIDVEGYGVVMAKAHGLNCIPVSIGFSGGSELFYKPEEQINPFLYAKERAQLWERETSLLTAAFTNVSMRGLLGPMIHVEGDEQVKVSYAGGMRVMQSNGKATPIDDKIIDPVIFQLFQKIDELNGESTIYGQTLGENIGSATFSSLAMLSSAGKLPLIDPQRALQQAFGGIFDYILYRIKSAGVVNPLIQPSDIPERYELEVEFKPKLPQDDLRNAQVASSVQGLVSQEWIQQNLLQIGDSAAMRKQITKEQVYQAIMGNLLQNPEFLNGLVMQVMGKPATPPAPQGQTQPGQQTPPEMQGQMSPEQMPTDPMTAAQGQPNMQQIEQSGPMIPQNERM